MFCNNCGKELKSEDKFCSECGSKVPKKEIHSYEEVVFNPPFRLEAEEEKTIDNEELHQEQIPEKKKYATIDFSWDISGYPTSDAAKSNQKPRDVIFDWSSPTGTRTFSQEPIKEETVKDEPIVTPPEIEQEVEPQTEELEFPEGEKDIPVEPELVEPKHIDIEVKAPLIEESQMPEGNGISVEDFLEELKNHKSREERRQEEAQKEALQGQLDDKAPEEEKKGFLAFFKGAFAEPKEEIAQESIQPEAIAEEERIEPEETIEETQEPEPSPFEEVIIPAEEEKNQIENEINQFLPEDKREDFSYDDNIDATRIVDKFYTFNKKNVEFQQLLDQEYEKIRGEKSLEQIKAEVRQSNKEANEFAKIVLEKKEAGELNSNRESKPNWDDIFGEEQEEAPKKKSKAGVVISTILLILAIIMGSSYAIVTFMPQSQAAHFIQSAMEKVTALVIPQKQEPQTKETVQDYIDNQIAANKNIGAVKYDPGLVVDMNRDYDTPGVHESQKFINSSFVNDEGTKVSYGDEITRLIISHYSDMAGKLQDSKMNSLSIGKFRVSDQGFFVITSYELETTNDGNIENNKELIFLSIDGNQVLIDKTEKL